jgi:glutamyl-Q tRNA(Asp) synthetase
MKSRKGRSSGNPRLASSAYVGRFAPSPTGPLHFGSLVAALASFLDARHHGGTWLLRIEDLDPPREQATAADTIIAQLAALGLHHDGAILYQSDRLAAYESAMARLIDRDLAYPCTCSRKRIEGIYDGRCRDRRFDRTKAPYAVRVRVDNRVLAVDDRLQGPQLWHLDQDVGDFVIKRRDGYFAYQLAVVVDDAFQGVTHIVRGDDLLDSMPRQVYLGDCLGFRRVDYLHTPLVMGADGEKLSKQNLAPGVATDGAALADALRLLGQQVRGNSVADIIDNAIASWDSRRIPRHFPRNLGEAGAIGHVGTVYEP